ncbi:hypothetical protein C8J55DRAFT_488574 [Lentinula edodes]|uniref:Uncharacterized protein n=1 Tax=Lentinula lateritia TaxID=40482 RepID=A0A9W9AJG8_9AGAR|nr:hypothetical protein C8J55DRAFT_488574 [Lentinula edodes]
MHLNTCVSILLGLALCLKAAPSTGHAKVSFVEHSNHKFGATEVDRIHRYIRDGVIFAKLASGDNKIDIPTDIPDANWIAFEIESSSPHCAPKTCKGVLYWDFWDALDRREAVMEIRDQHGIVMAEIGPGPKDNPTLNPQDAQKIYFDGTYEDPKGVHKKSYSVKS